jgi:ATP-binding cassette subfamily B protein
MGWIESSAMDEGERLDRAAAKQVMRRALRFLRPYRGQVALGFLVMAGATACLVAPPLVFAYVVDRISGALAHPAARHGAVAYVDRMALFLIALAVAAWLLSRAQIIIVTRVGECFLRDMRKQAFEHLLGMSLGFFDSEQTGRLVARMTADIDTMEDLVQQGLVVFVTNALIFVFTLTAMAVRSWELTLVCAVAVPGVVVASIWFRRVSNRAYLHVRDTVSETLSSLQEGLSGVRVVQAFTREESVVLRFGEHNRAQRDANLRATTLACIYFPVVEGSGIIAMAVAAGVGGLLVHRGVVTVGTVTAFFFWLTGLFEPINQVSQLYNLVQQAGAGLHKLYGLLDTQSPVRERAAAVDLPLSGPVELHHVTFSYAPALAPVLHDVSLSVPGGERLALVGPTGAGKSTLAKLVARFYDPVEGAVRFGGTDLRDATRSSLRKRIVVVPQEGHLFGGTIADNVRLGRPSASDDEVAEAMRALGALDRFPDLGMEVSERGAQLSAGERQIVSLARAFLADPRVLILDEATSNLDPGTEFEVERAVEALMEGRTVIVIAHRLSTAERADRVAVIDTGGLAVVGTHAELVERGGRYASLFASWVGAVP